MALLRRAFARAIRLLKLANDRDADFDPARALEWADGLPAQGARRTSMHRGASLHKELLDQSTFWRQS
jgi:hypothetical protein